MSIVIPLSGQKGVQLPLMDYQITGTNYFPWNSTNGVTYHYNGTNTADQSGTTGRIPFNQPIAAFGARAGGSPMYFGQPYVFGFYAGQTIDYSNSLRILVYQKSDYSPVNIYTISIPDPTSNTNEWQAFLTNGYSKTITTNGLTTTLYFDNPYKTWGINTTGPYHATHTADSSASNYIYQVEMLGSANGQFMVLGYSGIYWWSRLYTIEFQARPPWHSVFVDQPQFQGKPMPPTYDGKSIDELLTNTPPVTNAVNLPLAPTNYVILDQSPELRRHPVLDQFVSDMRSDPIAIATYVHNEIGLVDAMALNDSGSINDQSVNIGGVSRSALTTFLEGQGSPAELCSLLVYSLRQAGYPAVYVYPPRDQLLMLDTRLSKMLGMQLQGAENTQTGNIYTSNRLIAVNYPWVATYVSNRWVHLFPWIKDNEIVEGLNLWDVMPTNYNSAYKWVLDYVRGNTNLLSLAAENSPQAIFPAFLKKTLLQNFPGISPDDVGVKITKRPHSYTQWSDFPRPNYVTNVSYAVESFSDPGITNVSKGLTNIFDLVNITVSSAATPSLKINTGDLRMTDILNRKCILRFEKITSTTHRMILTLEPYRTNATGTGFFTNDTALLNKQAVTNNSLTSSDNLINVNVTYKRHRALAATNQFGFYEVAEPTDILTNQSVILKGDLAAFCFNVGTISKKMLDLHAQEYWNMEQQLKSNPSLTNTISPDIYQGTATYLMGMGYYEKIGRFRSYNERLQKDKILSVYSFGLSKLVAQRTSGVLPSGNIDLIQPHVDMVDQDIVSAGNRTLHPDSGNDLYASEANLSILDSANSSAQEHQIINSYFQQSDAVSTVRLLQLAQSRATNAPGMYVLNKLNYQNYGNSNYSGVALKNADTNIWNTVTNYFATAGEQNYLQWFVTPGNITNKTSTYKGMGAFLISIPTAYGAIISPNQLNGGSGENFPAGSFGQGNMVNMDLSVDADGNYIFNYASPSTTRTLAPDNPSTFQTGTVANNANTGQYTLTDFQNTYGTYTGNLYGGSPTTFGNALLTGDEFGSLGQSSDNRTVGQYLADPVNAVTGEFYINAVDLTLAGPMPLSVSRNYSSQNLSANQFGIGWKLNYMPFLCINSNASVIYAAEADGSVVAYQSVTTNLWTPSIAKNPNLNTFTTGGVGSTANLFNGKIVMTQAGTNTVYTLYSPDGSQRIFQMMTFAGAITSTRPYLTQWIDSRGNSYTCQYGTDPTQPDFGQARRIQSSNGNYLGFYFDVYGHIVDAYAGDGRRLHYDYDEFGDLVTVTLPDESQISYVYEHKNQSVTNGVVVTQQPYSTHLILQALKADGRELDNQYDNQRRVTNQLSTVGQDLTPIRNASFAYSNNFILTNSFTNTISGTTVVTDVNSNTIQYGYTNGLITNITDELGQTTVQQWYPDSTNAPGYPRSLWKRRDARNLLTEFQYDSAGNVTNTIVTGDLTGNGSTNEQAVTSVIYNTNNLPLKITDPATNVVQYVYDPVYTFLPQQIIKLAGSAPVVTNFMVYGNVTNLVQNGLSTVTNQAFGVMLRQIRAYGSTDASTNDFASDGRGFLIARTNYSGTTDPNVIVSYLYNARGELVQQTDSTNRSVRYDYDGLGHQTAKEFYDESSNIVEWTYTYYNDNGEVVWVDGPHFNPEDYTYRDYDGAGRLAQEIRWRVRTKADGSGVEAQTGDSLYATSFFQYDGFGNQTNVTDPLQNSTRMDYDALGRLIRQRFYDTNNTLLKTEGFAYEPGGKVAIVTNALNGLTSTFYTSIGKPKFRSNPDGTTNQWRYNLDGRVSKEFLPSGAYWQYTYDDANRRTTQELIGAGISPDPTEIKQYDRRGNLISLTDVDHNVFTKTYDGLDRLKTSAGPSGTSTSDQQITAYIYDNSGKVLTVTNSLGEKTITTSDVVGRPVSMEIRDASNALVRKTSTAYTLDHYSATVTNGTSNPMVTTTFSDTYGQPVLTQSFPTNGITVRAFNAYDSSGNLLSTVQSSLQGSTVTVYSSNAFTYDGLNRMKTQIRNGTETNTFSYDALGNITNRALPGPLHWIANYDSANRLTHEELRGTDNSTNRVFDYDYYTSGASVGLLQDVDDPRGIAFTYAYDGLRRLYTKSSSGSGAGQTMSTTYQYDNRGHAISINQTSSSQLGTAIARTFDGYGSLAEEQVSINGFLTRDLIQKWDAAGRRKELSADPSFREGPGAGSDILYGYRADGLMTSLNPGGTSSSFSYGDNGLLTGRSNLFRVETISQRDGTGRILSRNLAVNSTNQLQETLNWRPDGKLTGYSGAEPGFTDARTYAYSYNQMNRLTNETIPMLISNSPSTFSYGFDFGASGGPGILSQIQIHSGPYLGASGYTWGLQNSSSTYLNPSLRIMREEDNDLARRVSAGTATNVAYLISSIDNRESKNVDYDMVSGNWRTVIELPYYDGGSYEFHRVRAYHPTGAITASKTNKYAMNAADHWENTYDLFGCETQRVLKPFSGTTIFTQTLTWDAEGRLIKVANRDNVSDGYDWTATYDGLGRRLQTVYVPIMSGARSYSLTLDSWYDPQVQHLEIGVEINGGQRTWKIYGPDVSQDFSMQGLGGLESTIREYDGYSIGLLNDIFGDGIATITNGVTTFGKRTASYGPFPSQPLPFLSTSVSVAESTIWRGKRMDPTGLFYFGARYYDPNSARFISPDPLGHSASIELYAAFNGDSVNFFDPDGRLAKQAGYGASRGIDTVFNWGIGILGAPNGADGYTPEQIQFITQNGIDTMGSPMKNWFGVNYGNAPDSTAPSTFGPLIQNVGNAVATPVGQHAVDTTIQTTGPNGGNAYVPPMGPHEVDTTIHTEPNAATLTPYSEDGGHHIPAKSAFTGDPVYDPNAALAIPNAELDAQGISHSAITGAQQTLYRAYAQTGQPLTWEAMQSIETQALVKGGMNPASASVTVSTAINALKASGVNGPTRIPWGGK